MHRTGVNAHMCVSVQANAGICVQRPEANLQGCFLRDVRLCLVGWFMVLETKTGYLVRQEFA